MRRGPAAGALLEGDLQHTRARAATEAVHEQEVAAWLQVDVEQGLHAVAAVVVAGELGGGVVTHRAHEEHGVVIGLHHLGGHAGGLGDPHCEGELTARRARGARFPVPLMLMYAARDPMVPPEVGERMRALVPDAAFVKLREGSHFAHVDAPRVFLESAVPFLRGAER